MLRTRGKAGIGDELVATEAGEIRILLKERLGEGVWRVIVGGLAEGMPAAEVLARIGHVPLPPYIEKQRRQIGGTEETPFDRAWYQTVYAETTGGRSVAAPTAGLHFTPELLSRLEAKGVRRVAVELDVGMGTFLPVEAETLEAHRMHSEHYRVPAETVEAIRQTRARGGRLAVVGTTAVRTLETAAARILDTSTTASEIAGETELKIGPGFQFQLCDLLITNFHLPRSTLMALVAAFIGEGGVERLKSLYNAAVEEKYRFYSYGDAMYIHR